MYILKVLGGFALLSGGGLNVLAHPTTNEFQAREPASLGMLGEYTIVPATWVAPITPGGPNLNFTGTLQDVSKKIRELNPAYDPSQFGYLNSGRRNITDIAKRNAIVPPNCNVPYPAARVGYINTCIELAEQDPITQCVPPGPRVCSLLCGNNDDQGCNVIYVCNDNPYEICPSSNYLAGNYAQRIVDDCTYSSNGVSYVHGQEFDTDGYNVIVSADCAPSTKKRAPSASDEVQRREPEALGMIGEYKIVPATWVGPVIPGGPNVTLSGNTFQKIHQQILELNPTYNSDFEYLRNEQANSTAITKRSAILPADCNVPYWVTGTNAAVSVIAYIVGMEEEWSIPAGPRVCTTIYHQGSNEDCANVYVCNDNPYRIDVHIPDLASSHAWQILVDCPYDSGGVSWVHGQVFDTDGFNVIVSGSCDPYRP